LALGILALIAFLWPGFTTQKNIAVAATPTPVALQYDQIIRMILPPATPPAPGAFPTDYAAIVATPAAAGAGGSATATPSPVPNHGGLAGLLGAVMGGAPNGGEQSDSDNPMANVVNGAMDKMRKGTLERYTYYKGWLRTDDPVAQMAVISKCQENQYIVLDLAKKTYTLTNTKPACSTMPQMPVGPGHTTVENEAPGTVDMTVSNSVQTMGPMMIQSIATTGYDNTMQMSMANATGSCTNANVGMNMEQYISKIAIPHQYCPLPHTAYGGNPTDVVVHGGCKPKMHVSGTGTAEMEMDKLVMFSKMTFNAAGGGNPHPGGFAAVTERGNVKWLSGAPADALFTIPPGFSKAQ